MLALADQISVMLGGTVSLQKHKEAQSEEERTHMGWGRVAGKVRQMSLTKKQITVE